MKTTTKQLELFALIVGLIFTAACSSGSSTSTSTPERTIIGNVSNESSASLVPWLTRSAMAQEASDDCLVDTVIATTTSGDTETAIVDESCDFSLTLTTSTSYVISFTLNDEFVATLVFESGLDGSDVELLGLTAGNTIDLGQISFFDDIAESEFNALEDVDQDEDGVSDYDDDDFDAEYELEIEDHEDELDEEDDEDADDDDEGDEEDEVDDEDSEDEADDDAVAA